jgi:hypothetical protein
MPALSGSKVYVSGRRERRKRLSWGALKTCRRLPRSLFSHAWRATTLVTESMWLAKGMGVVRRDTVVGQSRSVLLLERGPS